jgi:hypothetical protein
MKDLDLSDLGPIDSVDENYGMISFRCRARSMMFDVIMFVDRGVFREASSSCTPGTGSVMPFGRAWARCMAFIEANGLKPEA